jgi:dUTP pyrophosphatase
MTDEPSPAQGAALPVPVRLLTPLARLPERAYEHDAAWDLYAAEDATLPPLHRAVVGTGIALGLPPELAALTLPRSGLAARHGISIVNAPGLIDPGYRGEVRIILLNTDTEAAFSVAPGDRIAQLLFLPLTDVRLLTAEGLDDTHRGERGFGSSGTGGRT